jgi:sigma-54 dependent transcriptional regulator, acetoin dehydrogenase operon transcriptional activator AcoR
LQANGGTLLLDEIGDMPMNLQPALLRFLDSWTVRPLGSNREVRVDVQLIASTNCELEAAIEEKRFRRDLLHRINGVEISLPPLRERSDFEEIVRDILTRISPNTGIEEGAVECLREQPWTGNMRELKNVLVRAMLFCTEPNLSARALEPFLQKHSPTMDVQGPESQELHDLRRKAIVNAYHRNKGNISKSAQSLSISRNTVYRELRLAGLIKSGSRVHA